MEIFKIDNISDFLKDNISYSIEVLYYKNWVEDYIRTFFGHHINLKLEEKLNIIFDGVNYCIAFDKMALLKPLAHLLDVAIDENSDYETIKSAIQIKIFKLRTVTTIEGLICDFPVINDIYTEKSEKISKSVSLEKDCSFIKPYVQAEEIKRRKLHEYGITSQEHMANIMESLSFSFKQFVENYTTEIDAIFDNLDFLVNGITNYTISSNTFQTIDKKKVEAFIKSAQNQKKHSLS